MVERFDRNSIECLNMVTVNPCNNFIVDYLIRTKIKSDKQVSTRYYMYNLAIESVRKYPLPLICGEQLATLEGFGDFFINRVSKIIKKHYTRGRMPTAEEMDEDDKEHLEEIRDKRKEVKIKMEGAGEGEDENIGDDYDENQGEMNEFEEEEGDERDEKDQKSIRSQSKQSKVSLKSSSKNKLSREPDSFRQSESKMSRKRRKYNPRKGTEPYEILKALVSIKADERQVSKGDLNEYMFNERKEKMKGWGPVRDRLAEFGYITSDPLNVDLVMMTKMGKDYVLKLEENGDVSDSSHENKSDSSKSSQNKKRSHSSRSRSRSLSISLSGNSESENKSRNRSQSKSEDDFSSSSELIKKKSTKSSPKEKNKMAQRLEAEPSRTIERTPKPQRPFKGVTVVKEITSLSKQMRNRNDRLKVIKDELLTGKSYKDPVIVFNEKYIDDEEEIQEIKELLGKSAAIKFKSENLSFGDFALVIGDLLLDFVVIRIKIESFDLDEFYLTLEKAKESQFDNIYIIIEESSLRPKPGEIKNAELNRILANCRVCGFRICRAKGLSMSINFILRFAAEITSKVHDLNNIKSMKELNFMGELEEYNTRMSSLKKFEGKTIMISGLLKVPNIKPEIIKSIVKIMPTYKRIYDKLSRLKKKERKSFLNWYLRNVDKKKRVSNIVADLLCLEKYEEND